VTSCTTRISNLEVTGINQKQTGRILVYDRLEFVVIRLWEVVIVNVLLELCIGPGVGNQSGLFCGWRSTHVTLRLDKLNRVPSSSQFPGVTGSITTENNEYVALLPMTNGMLATRPCNTSCCGGDLRNVPSTLGLQARFKDCGT
jgi:hypothetical protein